MLSTKDIKFLRRVLLEWFGSNQRNFPWRKEGVSNYEIILCEILLQRTQANTVSRYYSTFFGRYPNWEKLTQANIQDLEEIIKPLGLYRQRAQRIFKIAQEYKEKKGILPRNKNELQESSLASLYISNAYELFVLKRRSALLDVNLLRVFSRYFDLPEIKMNRNNKKIQELANYILNVRKCKELNWAVMDFAALVCKTHKPKCNSCVLRSKCRYFRVEGC